MDLKAYLKLYMLLETDRSTKEERRAFGLSLIHDRKHPFEQLLSWITAHESRLKSLNISDTLPSYLYRVTLLLTVIGLIAGVISGIALLSYNGKEPVNVVYFMMMVVFLPLFTMFLTLLSMIKTKSTQSVLVHISPSFWMERIIALLPSKWDLFDQPMKINPLLANWIVLKRAQLIALYFSFGLLLSLVVIISTKDIAFAWSTTLEFSPESFQHLLQVIALPWREWIPTAVPSMDLVEQSQYYRLGEGLSDEMIGNASKLGEWWKFLALSTLFYAIVLRFVLYLVTKLGYVLALKRSILSLDGVNVLLRDMNEPVISTHSQTVERHPAPLSNPSQETLCHLDASYDVVQGWAISGSQIAVICETMKIISPKMFEVGGANSLEEDKEIIAKSHGEVLLFVKAWEPPTMDFIDFVELLVKKVDRVIVFPIGDASNMYKAQERFIEIWIEKLALLEDDKVCLLQPHVKESHG